MAEQISPLTIDQSPLLIRAAKFFTYLFHPLLLPTYSFALVIYTNPYLFGNYGDYTWIPILKVFLNTFMFPVFAVLMMRQLGFLKSFTMNDAKERIIPYISTLMFFIWTFMVFCKSGDPVILSAIMLGACLATSVAFLINMFRKISLHATGMGAMLALAFGNAFFSAHNLIFSLMLVSIIAGVIGTSRLVLKAHRDSDLYLGYFIGFMMQMVAFKFM